MIRSEMQEIFVRELNDICENTLVYRNYDHLFVKEMAKPESTIRKIKINFIFRDTASGFCLTAVDEDGISVEYLYETNKIVAENPENVIQSIKKQLLKVNNTVFEPGEITVELTEPFFLPISVMNDLRRKVLGLLENKRVEDFELKKTCHKVTSVGSMKNLFLPKKLDYTANAMNIKAVEFYESLGIEHIEPAFELQQNNRGKTIMTTKYCILFETDRCLLK
ncbi:MAG: DUF3656 domain-containing protein [Bacteroidales bacterium]|nr:DUF3656 domain-containing protein [Bacteroidales bacterium]